MEKQATRNRRLVLGAALVATLLAVIAVEENDVGVDEIALPVVPARTTGNKASNQPEKLSHTAQPSLSQLGQRKFRAEADDIFAATSWQPKSTLAGSSQSFFGTDKVAKPAPSPPPPPVIAAPPPPVAPPLQYKYVGRITEGKITRVFLTKAENNYIASVGERIESDYRVDQIDDDAIVLTYLPLGIKQTLSINNNNPGKFP